MVARLSFSSRAGAFAVLHVREPHARLAYGVLPSATLRSVLGTFAALAMRALALGIGVLAALVRSEHAR